MPDLDKDGEDIWQQANMANALNHMKQTQQEQIKFIQIFAQLRFAKYQALIDAGFTKEQALLIVTNTKVME
jgi:hypothetical protein